MNRNVSSDLITISYEDIDFGIEVEFVYTEGVPAVLGGLPENCSPEESAEIDVHNKTVCPPEDVIFTTDFTVTEVKGIYDDFVELVETGDFDEQISDKIFELCSNE